MENYVEIYILINIFLQYRRVWLPGSYAGFPKGYKIHLYFKPDSTGLKIIAIAPMEKNPFG